MVADGTEKPSAAEKRRKACELRLAGIGYQEIANRLGYRSVSGAWEAVQRGMTEYVREASSTDQRQLDLDRLDALTASLWAKARRGNMEAVDRLLKIMDRRSRYLGLDVGANNVPSGSGGGGSKVVDINARRAARRANAKNQQSP